MPPCLQMIRFNLIPDLKGVLQLGTHYIQNGRKYASQSTTSNPEATGGPGNPHNPLTNNLYEKNLIHLLVDLLNRSPTTLNSASQFLMVNSG